MPVSDSVTSDCSKSLMKSSVKVVESLVYLNTLFCETLICCLLNLAD
ncbi:10782_t:CDS:2 [Rhizophagus irregularis]|nr:10782_t:CDS:2 [Rhizophagus irregularis]